MVELKSENVVMVDVDDTILMWSNPTEMGANKVAIEFAGDIVYLTPHNYHIQLIKKYHERGYLVIVWSANGVSHATQAVNVLGLKPYVNFTMTKPSKHMDDSKDASSILGPRVYIDDLTKPPPLFQYFVETPPKGVKLINFDIEGNLIPDGLDTGILNGR